MVLPALCSLMFIGAFAAFLLFYVLLVFPLFGAQHPVLVEKACKETASGCEIALASAPHWPEDFTLRGVEAVALHSCVPSLSGPAVSPPHFCSNGGISPNTMKVQILRQAEQAQRYSMWSMWTPLDRCFRRQLQTSVESYQSATPWSIGIQAEGRRSPRDMHPGPGPHTPHGKPKKKRTKKNKKNQDYQEHQAPPLPTSPWSGHGGGKGSSAPSTAAASEVKSETKSERTAKSL